VYGNGVEVMEPTNKSYKFSSFQEMLEVVPHDRIELCLTELGKALQFANDTIISKLGFYIVPTLPKQLEWVDDGKGEIGFSISGKQIVVDDKNDAG